MNVVRIDNWAIVASRKEMNQSTPPPIHLRGFVTGHPDHADGSEITTSHIAHRMGQEVVTCNGTHYELGSVNPAYHARFPNAKEDLLRMVPWKAEERTIVITRSSIATNSAV
jgi:hypothetical protein